MAKDKTKRYATAVELAKALNMVAFGNEGNLTSTMNTGLRSGVYSPTTTQPSRGRTGLAVGGIVLVVTVAIIIVTQRNAISNFSTTLLERNHHLLSFFKNHPFTILFIIIFIVGVSLYRVGKLYSIKNISLQPINKEWSIFSKLLTVRDVNHTDTNSEVLKRLKELEDEVQSLKKTHSNPYVEHQALLDSEKISFSSYKINEKLTKKTDGTSPDQIPGHLSQDSGRTRASIELNIEKALNLMCQGDKVQASILLADVLLIEKKHEAAWLMLSMTVEKTQYCMDCLQHVLKINPNNSFAAEEFNRIQSAPTDSKNAFIKFDDKYFWRALIASVQTETQREICLNKINSLDVSHSNSSEEQEERKSKEFISSSEENANSIKNNYQGSSEPVFNATPQSSSSSKSSTNLKELPRLNRKNYVKILNLLERLTLYILFIALPFEIEHVYFGRQIELFHALLLTITILFVVSKILEKRPKIYWGWWYVIIPFALYCLQSNIKNVDLLMVILLYILTVNIVKESSYWELGLTAAVSILILTLVHLNYIQSLILVDDINIGQWVTILALISLGLSVSSRYWTSRIFGSLISIIVIFTVLRFYPDSAAGLFTFVMPMMFLWLLVRMMRLWPQLIIFSIVLFAGFGLALIVNGGEITSEIKKFIEVSSPYGWILIISIAILPLSALVSQVVSLKVVIFPTLLFFDGLLNALIMMSNGVSFSLVAVINWAGLSILQLLIQLVLIVLLSPLFFIALGGSSEKRGVSIIVSVIILLAIVFVCLLLYSEFPSSWLLHGLLIPLTSILLGAIVLSLSLFSLNIGCGGILVVVTLLVYGVSYILHVPEPAKISWNIILPVMLGFSAWRSQRIWTIIFASCMM
ncbi:MAG: hypothetical protein Q7U54_09745, partial [Bacteroidales bacterium]|nr:hypothetical protein [Bacteroidales bacterium]